ncbi:MAG: AAA family ATPase, partial [Planctomycetaceae bacterium]|nr:AAA family ATPase [Planctomycetaceae bacterium]
MKIKSIYVNNFKSLVDFKIDLAKFNCLIGLNGSGKSTFLQFISFLSQLMKGNVEGWLQKRKWTKEDIVPHFDNKTNRTIQFEIQFQCDDQHGYWKCDYSADHSRSIYEKFTLGEVELEVFNQSEQSDKYTFKGNRTEKINFSYLGSIFSQLADKEITEVFKKVIRYFRSIHSFDLLSPYYLKQRSKSTSGSIGFAGEDLAPFLFDLNDELRSKVIGKIKTVYPEFNSFSSSQLQDGTKQITITEQYRDGNIQYAVPARIANDGIMRIIAIIAQLNAKTDFLLFDEIENGINQELVDFLLKQLVNAEQQIVVTTHSPLFMNYLNDELAKESVTYFYKTPEGYT